MAKIFYTESDLIFQPLPKSNKFRDLSDAGPFGRLAVLGFAGTLGIGKKLKWFCKCDCGRIIHASATHLVSGHTTSCGCLHVDTTRARSITHGMTKSAEYVAWMHAISRCHNPDEKSFPDYGGRGISVCEEWRNSFETFFRDVGKRPGKGYELDRRDNDLGYSKDNCRWITKKDNSRNRRDTIYINYENRKQALVLWAEEKGIEHSVLYARHRQGWCVKCMFEIPVDTHLTCFHTKNGKKRFNLTLHGETDTATSWSKRKGISYDVIRKRMKDGWCDKCTLELPPAKSSRGHREVCPHVPDN